MKYFGLTALVLLLATLIFTWTTIETKVFVADIGGDRIASQNALREADSELASIRNLHDEMPLLAARLFEPVSDLALIEFVPRNRIVPDTEQVKFPKRRVTLLYSGVDFYRAVIDGAYVSKGDTLPRGGRVLEISKDQVVLQESLGRRVIKLDASVVRSAAKQRDSK